MGFDAYPCLEIALYRCSVSYPRDTAGAVRSGTGRHETEKGEACRHCLRNGNGFKNGGNVTCVVKAYLMLTSGSDVLDAVIAGVNIIELDPEDTSVGYGGLPNAEGVVQLDSCCMDGPTRRAGGVAALEGVRTPSTIAQLVMDQTDHHLLVGKGAQDFARTTGFEIEGDLNTEKSRHIWLEWRHARSLSATSIQRGWRGRGTTRACRWSASG